MPHYYHSSSEQGYAIDITASSSYISLPSVVTLTLGLKLSYEDFEHENVWVSQRETKGNSDSAPIVNDLLYD